VNHIFDEALTDIALGIRPDNWAFTELQHSLFASQVVTTREAAQFSIARGYCGALSPPMSLVLGNVRSL